MLPIDAFNSVWARVDTLRALHTYLTSNTTTALNSDELLRAEWVARVSALDLYVHEVIAQGMLATFQGSRPQAAAFDKFRIGAKTLMQIKGAPLVQAAALFDLEVRTRLSFVTYQDPDKIAEGIRLISDKALWNEVAKASGAATQQQAHAQAKLLKRELSLIVARRNKIAHEGDLQPTLPRVVWPIHDTDVQQVKAFILKTVTAINSVV